HMGHNCSWFAWRSKPEGRKRLSLSSLVRCRILAGRSADDAVHTYEILLTDVPGLAGINNSSCFSGAFRRSRDFTRHWRLSQLTKRRSRTFITRPMARKTNNVAEPP